MTEFLIDNLIVQGELDEVFNKFVDFLTHPRSGRRPKHQIGIVELLRNVFKGQKTSRIEIKYSKINQYLLEREGFSSEEAKKSRANKSNIRKCVRRTSKKLILFYDKKGLINLPFLVLLAIDYGVGITAQIVTKEKYKDLISFMPEDCLNRNDLIKLVEEAENVVITTPIQHIKKSDQIRCFLYYAHRDSSFASRIAHDLESQGIFVWLDDSSIYPDRAIPNHVQKGLTDFDCFLIVLSPSNIKSAWVIGGLITSLGHFKLDKKPYIIPILRKKCDIPQSLQDFKYLDFTKDSIYSDSIIKLFDTIVFEPHLIGKYRKSLPSGIIVENIHIKALIYGEKQEFSTFEENYTIKALRPVKIIIKEFVPDGYIDFVNITCGSLTRTPIRKNAERWTIDLDQIFQASEKTSFTIIYRLKNEFEFSNYWYYTIDTATRRLIFDWEFSLSLSPRWLKCVTLETTIPIEEKLLNKEEIERGTRFRFDVELPKYQYRYDFTWGY